jgi:multidrug efflux pump subunit AcrA (membrane-fusion protein)
MSTMKRFLFFSAIIVISVFAAIFYLNGLSKKKDIGNLYVKPTIGRFEILVITTGELEAENSKDIRGPNFTLTRNIRAIDIKITSLVPEGTIVKKGDYVATLDRTSFNNNLKDELEKIKFIESSIKVKMLDTAVNLSNLRDNIKNLNYAIEEAKNILAVSRYEPPTTIRQAEMTLDKAQRALDQAEKSYSLRVAQARADIRTLQSNLLEQHKTVSDLQDLLSNFVITAPSDGMVIYKKEETGTKRKVGSSISLWDNVVATLPDLSTMISRTYVNEIDISKISIGQNVVIIVDAFPNKSFKGTVKSISNIGEQLISSDAKVFEVLIKLNESDLILRPAMTTSNKIITKVFNDVVSLPLEGVHTGEDSLSFVYLKKGVKQIVVLGEANDNSIIIKKGIDSNEEVFLTHPKKAENFRLRGNELIANKNNETLFIQQEVDSIYDDMLYNNVISEKESLIHNETPEENKSNIDLSKRSNTPQSIVIYRVQFESNVKSKGSFEISIDGISMRTYEYYYKGAYRSCAGEYLSLDKAIELRNKMQSSGYKQAFVAAFQNNERTLNPDLFK